MSEVCDNELVVFSTEQGIKDVIRWMLKNLEDAEMLDPSEVPGESASVAELESCIRRATNDSPTTLRAIASGGEFETECSEYGSAWVSKLDDLVWQLEYSFQTIWSSANFEPTAPKTTEPRIVLARWKHEYDPFPDEGAYANDGTGEWELWDHLDYEYGKPDCYISAFYEMIGRGPLPANPEKIKRLLKHKKYDEILAMKDDPAVREACTHVSAMTFFKKKKMDAYVTLLKMTDNRYHPTKVDEYLDVLRSSKYAEVLPVFIKRYAWDKKSAALAYGFLASKRNGKEALALLEAKLKECGVPIPDGDAAQAALAKKAGSKRKAAPKKGWTEKNADKFMAMIESSSVEQLKSFIKEIDEEHIPPWPYKNDQQIFKACIAKPYEAAEKLNFFIEEGASRPFVFSFTDLVGYDYKDGLKNTPEELEALKDVFRLLSDKGWTFTDVFSSDLIAATLAYHSDLEFLKSLTKMGLDFDEAVDQLCLSEPRIIVEALFEASSFDTLDFLVEKGLPLSRWGECTIASNWSDERINYLVSKNQPILLEGFNPDCNLDVYSRAVEKSGMNCKNPSNLWSRIINWRRFDIGEYLLQKGIATCSDRICVRIDDISVIDWALSKGLALNVDIEDCSRDTLLYAAKHAVRPVGSLDIDTKSHQIRNNVSREERLYGMKAICELFDVELIKAFLDAGFADEADASSAVEEGNQELIDLYASYGVDTSLKRVIDGSKYVEDGIARIPEGIEEITHDAFEGVAFDSVELPSTLKTIGKRAFARNRKDPEVEEITVPKSVASLGYGAFEGFKRISVYDNLDADAEPAHSKIDDCNGVANGSVGWVGAAPWKGYTHCAGNAVRANHEITVLSAETDEVKFRVEMPIGSAARDVYCTLVSAWGKNVEFDFSVYKEIFKRLPGKESKLKTAINRLTWPINLDEESREIYEQYVIRNAKDAAALFAKQDNLAGFKLLASIGAIKRANIDEMISSAASANCMDAVEYLESYRAD